MTKQQYEELRKEIISSFRDRKIGSGQAVAALKELEARYKKERKGR